MTRRLNYARQSRSIFEKLTATSIAVKNESSLDAGLLHLIDIRASQINGCAFCVDLHIKEAKIHGERELRIHHLTIWRESTLFTDKERVALELTEAVTRLGNEGISDELYKRVSDQFVEQEISDLVFAIATINAWNRLGVTFRAVPGSGDKALGLDKAGLN